MLKDWKILPKKSDDLMEQLLFNRGIKTKKEIEEFFNPKLENFKKDLEIPGISSAQRRIQKSIASQELIIVYGDYDVDGVSASAILYKALTSIGGKVMPYIPHRDKEGYGLSNTGLEFARDSGASLVITVDNGIVAINQAKFAKEIGLDLIITDHHLPLDSTRGHGPNLPDAYAIVHSTKMCGAAVAWCLVKDLVSKSLSTELLQFVAIATIGDLIPLIGVGRAFVYEGLKVLRNTTNLGLVSLLNECNIEITSITSYEVGHILIPRLNAIGRLEHAIDALRLLCTKDSIKAKKLAKLLSETNVLRREITTTAVEEAKLMVSKNSTKKIYVLQSKTWPSGVIGLIAGRISEESIRPVIALSVGETHAKGSARSIGGINIVEVIRKCSDILVDVGGHAGAAGFSIQNDKINEFKKRMEDLMDGEVDDIKTPILEIEAEVESKKLTKELIKDLDKFEPFGFGNSKPIFATKVMKVSDIRTLSEGKHLKFKADGFDAIAFSMGNLAEVIKNNSLVDIAYYLEINKFNGKEILQLKVKDLKLANSK